MAGVATMKKIKKKGTKEKARKGWQFWEAIRNISFPFYSGQKLMLPQKLRSKNSDLSLLGVEVLGGDTIPKTLPKTRCGNVHKSAAPVGIHK